ncbi:MAG: protein rep [Candidatus Pacearchaeota archaeon]|jgi:hypothetical protein
MDSNDSQSPEGSLLGSNVISSHFDINLFALELEKVGYPKKSIQSLLDCGHKPVDYKLLKEEEGNLFLFTPTYKCTLTICPVCAKIRSNRIRREILPFLKSLSYDKTYYLYFLTISPRNCSNLEEGMKIIRKNYQKFLRLKEVKDKIIASIYVIEVTGTESNWHVHIHAIVYGKYFDNKIRGHCNKCGQNLMAYDKTTEQYYCANSKCNSKDVSNIKHSKLVRLWVKTSKQEVNMHVTSKYFDKRNKVWRYTKDHPEFVINYLLKYISMDKNKFQTYKDFALYAKATHNKRLLNKTGIFYRINLKELYKRGILKKAHRNSNYQYFHSTSQITEFYKNKNKYVKGFEI